MFVCDSCFYVWFDGTIKDVTLNGQKELAVDFEFKANLLDL